jgi:hypothetical protein
MYPILYTRTVFLADWNRQRIDLLHNYGTTAAQLGRTTPRLRHNWQLYVAGCIEH